jgi:protein TonB
MRTAHFSWLGSIAAHTALAGGLLWLATDRLPVNEVGWAGAVIVVLGDVPAETPATMASASTAPSIARPRVTPDRTMPTRSDLHSIQPSRAEIIAEPTPPEPADASQVSSAVIVTQAVGDGQLNVANVAAAVDAESTQGASAGGTVVSADPWPAYFATVRAAVERAKHYPFSARMAGLEDRITVSFFITADGAAEQIRLAEPSRFPVLNDAAVDTIRRAARFPSPPLHGSQAGVRMTVPMSFTLYDHEEAQPH